MFSSFAVCRGVMTHGMALAVGISAAHALEPSDVLIFSKDPVMLRPQLSLSEMYNDNIFYQSGTRISDFITVLSPGFDLQLGKDEGNHLGFEYRYDHMFYLDHDELNAGEHSFLLDSRLAGERLELTGADQISFYSRVLSGREEGSLGGARSGNVEFQQQVHDYTLSYQLTAKTRLYVGGEYRSTDYEEGIFLYDTSTWQGTAGFGLLTFPEWGFFGETYYGQSSAEPNFLAPDSPESWFAGGFVGVRGNFTPKLTGMAKAGYEVREFEDGTEAPNAPVVQMSLSHQLREKTRVTVGYTRRTYISAQSARQAYTGDLATIQVGQGIGTSGKWLATFGGSYQLRDYESEVATLNRTDSWWQLYAGLTYNIQLWLRVSAQYEYEKFHSGTRRIVDYDVNRVTLRLALGY